MKSEMKLVDILARHLQEWPKENPSVIAQDDDGNVYGWTRSPERGDRQWLCGIANLAGFVFGSVDKIELSSDHKEANVTRSQWQAAVDALKARDQAWDGEGLPPVGTICEFRVETDYWRQCEVIAHKDGSAICWIHCNKIFSTSGAAIRPIRTAEQIAAEERQKGIEELGNFLSANSTTPTPYLWEAAQKIYDAGYRKQEVQQ